MATAIMPDELHQHEENIYCAPLAELEVPEGVTPRQGRYVQGSSIIKAIIKAFAVDYQQHVTNVMWNHFKSRQKEEHLLSGTFVHKHTPLGLFIHEDIARNYAVWFANCCRKRAAQENESTRAKQRFKVSRMAAAPLDPPAGNAAAPTPFPRDQPYQEALSPPEIELAQRLDKFLLRFDVLHGVSEKSSLPAASIAVSLTNMLSHYEADTVSAVMRSQNGKRIRTMLDEFCPGAYTQIDWPRLLLGYCPLMWTLLYFVK